MMERNPPTAERRARTRRRAAALLCVLGALAWGAAEAKPIKITTATQLQFGRFTRTNTAGTLTVSATGTRTVTGGVVALTGGTIAAARFNITGDPSVNYTITLPPTANITSGAQTMSVSFNSTLVTGGTLVRMLNASGTDTLSVGAVLNVSATQVAGSYTGSFVMTVNY
ncbi:MAG TPA: DUF4402 domain-containing protein [Azospirillaceae bacterium]|nr:DUF4402 domain-containing protein [Azospirillaceae bacterium]